ncbi:hypothetical protein Golax_009732 [Gossypium laxum]|uniref:Uncharacterized protein n=1 Tax=Gossypium laxum TaxID=34288 RepID=A0A7J8ZGQ3_9ROSI|nr:hypothetical protein [Gossypium laxum]
MSSNSKQLHTKTKRVSLDGRCVYLRLV